MNKILVLLCNAERVFRPVGATYVCVKNYRVYVDDAMFNELKAIRAQRGDAKYPDKVKAFYATHDVVDFPDENGNIVHWMTSGDAC